MKTWSCLLLDRRRADAVRRANRSCLPRPPGSHSVVGLVINEDGNSIAAIDPHTGAILTSTT